VWTNPWTDLGHGNVIWEQNMKLKTWGLYNETIQYQIPTIKQNLTNHILPLDVALCNVKTWCETNVDNHIWISFKFKTIQKL
jgi:hypothetical protein